MSSTALTEQMVWQGLTEVDVLQGDELAKRQGCVISQQSAAGHTGKIVPRLEQLPPKQVCLYIRRRVD